MNSFASLHPVTLALYFVSVLLITMFAAHPLLLGVAMVGGLLCFLTAGVPRRFGQSLGLSALLFAVVALTNPLFSHHGATVLFFLNGNPITLEAVLYGVQLAMAVTAVIRWFAYLNRVLTGDKLLFLFGRLSPKLALLLSSALRFLPLLREQAARIRTAQTAMGLYASDTWTDKLRGTVRVYSALVTWSLENAVDTGASMKARGYGLPGRRCYAPYTYRARDAWLTAVIAAADTAVVAALVGGHLEFVYYPTVTYASVTPWTVAAVTAFAVLCLLPCILEMKEGLTWKYCVSKV